MKSYQAIIGTIIGIVSIIGVSFGAYNYIDEKKADKEIVVALSKEVLRDRINNHIIRLDERIWSLKQQQKKAYDPEVAKEINALEIDKDKLLREIK